MSVEADTQSFSEIRQVATTLILLFCKKKNATISVARAQLSLAEPHELSQK